MATFVGATAPSGALKLKVFRGPSAPTFWTVLRDGLPRPGLSSEANKWRLRNFRRLLRPAIELFVARRLSLQFIQPALYLKILKADGRVLDLGLASLHKVTDAGVKYICDDFKDHSAVVNNLKYHGFGTGGTAESAGDTALVTELTTQYATDNVRPTGSQASAGPSGNAATYTTVGTLVPDSGVAITEHGIFSQAAVAGGTLLDRSLFSVVNLSVGDSLQATYVFTVNSNN